MRPSKNLVAILVISAAGTAAVAFSFTQHPSLGQIVFFAVALVIFVPTMLVTLDTFCSDLQPQHYWPDIHWYGDQLGKNVVVWLPGVGNNGVLSALHYYRELLEQGWSVLVLDHNRRGFSMDDTVLTIHHQLARAHRHNILLVGQSLGSLIAAESIRHRGFNLSRVRVISVCGLAAASDVKLPGVYFSPIVHGHVMGWLYQKLQARYIRKGQHCPCDPEVEPELVKQHERERMYGITGRGLLMEIAAIVETKPLRANEFPTVRAMIICTEGDDVMVKAQATQKLREAFPISRIYKVKRSIHADLVELPREYGPPIFAMAAQTIAAEPAS